MSLLDEFTLIPILNGVGPATRLGGLNVDVEIVAKAQKYASYGYRMEELHMVASDFFAKRLSVPGGIVTAGAAAALTIATAVTLTANYSGRMAQLPHVTWNKKKVLVQRMHHDPYDHAVIASGAELEIVGTEQICTKSDIQEAIAKGKDEITAFVYRANDLTGHLSFEEVAVLCKEADIPLIVDAAIHVPPIDRLQRYFALGARFVTTSGGKGFRGPHTAGILFCSEQDAILALLHHLDMDERSATWPYLQSRSRLPLTLPGNGIGRAMKVGKEQIFQMMLAVEAYLEEPSYEIGNRELDQAERTLVDAGIDVVRYANDFLHVDTLKFFIGSEQEVDDFYLGLQEGNPRVVLGQELSRHGYLTINPMALLPGEGRLIGDRIAQLFAERSSKVRN
jgi:L-seryl-tRNA(Ser) seleniumtransferase